MGIVLSVFTQVLPEINHSDAEAKVRSTNRVNSAHY